MKKLLSNEITILEFITKSPYLYEFHKEDYYKNVKFFEEKIQELIVIIQIPKLISIKYLLLILLNLKSLSLKTIKSQVKITLNLKNYSKKKWFTDYSYSPYKTSRPYLNDENECFLIGIDKKGTKILLC